MPVLPFSISYNKGIPKFKVPSKIYSRRQNDNSFFQYASNDIIDIHDKSTAQPTAAAAANGDEERNPPKDSLDSTSTERREMYFEPLDVNISPEPLMSSFPPGFLKNSFIHPRDGDKRATRASSSRAAIKSRQEVQIQDPENAGSKEPSDDGGGLDMNDEEAEELIAELKKMNASDFFAAPSSSPISPPAPSTVDLNHKISTWRRSTTPAPIKIVTANGSKSQAVQDPEPTETEPLSQSQSEVSSPASSAVSGTTLARALISNTFVLSIDTRDSRKYRSGMSALARSDSATLPMGEHPFFPLINGRESAPPVPPIPSEAELLVLASKASTPHSLVYRRKTGDFKRRSSTGSMNTSMSSAHSPPIVSSDDPLSAVIDSVTTGSAKSLRRISRISEVTTSVPGTPVRFTGNDVQPEDKPDDHTLPSSPEILASEQGAEDDVPREEEGTTRELELPQPSGKPLPELPSSPTSTEDAINNFGYAASPNDFFDYYSSNFSPDSLPKGFRPAFSPITEVSEPSASSGSQFSGYPPQKQQSQKSPMFTFSYSPHSTGHASIRSKGSLSRSGSSSTQGHARLPYRERPRSHISPSPSFRRQQSYGSYSSIGSDLIPPPPHEIVRRKRSGSAPSPIVVIRDQDLARYKITMSPGASSDSPPSTSDGVVQTFPETPDMYSPTWSGLATSSSIHRRLRELEVPPFPQSPMSATLPNFAGAGQSLAQAMLLTRATTVARSHRQSSLRRRGRDGAEPGGDEHPHARENEDTGATMSSAPSTETTEQTEITTNESQEAQVVESSSSLQSRRRSGSIGQSSIKGGTAHMSRSIVEGAAGHPVERRGHQHGLSSASNDTIFSLEQISRSSSSVHIQPPPAEIVQVTTVAQSSSLNRAASPTPSPTLQPATPSVPTHADQIAESPPPYYSVFRDHLAAGSTPVTPGFENFRLSPHSSGVSLGYESPAPGSRRATRPRPRLPVGPRERRNAREARSASALMRDRNGSVSSVGSNVPNGSTQQSATTLPSPQFTVPAPRFKGLTMEAAKWTFTSSELQEIVSRAIQESSQGSSIRLLHLSTLDNEINEDRRRLEAERRGIQGTYKALSRNRHKLLDELSTGLSSSGSESPGAPLRLLEKLKNVSAQLDTLAEDLHSVDEQLACLNALVLKHSAGALSMALRKLNKSWLERTAELEGTKREATRLEAERDEAYGAIDEMMQKATNPPLEIQHKSGVRKFKAGLNSSSRRSSFSSHRMSGGSVHLSSAKSPFLFENLPPMPPLPLISRRRKTSNMSINIPARASSQLLSNPTPITPDPTVILEQEELYVDIERRIGALRRSRSYTVQTTEPSGRPIASAYPRQDPASPNFPPRPSSLPGGSRLSDVYKAMNVDGDAMLVTLRMLSDSP